MKKDLDAIIEVIKKAHTVSCDDIASDPFLCDAYEQCPVCGAKLIDGVMVHEREQ